MADRIRTLLRLWRLYARMDLAWLLQDWTAAAVILLSEVMNSVSAMLGVLLLAVRFGGVGGLSADEILFMLGFFELANGLCWMLFGNYNVMHISRRVGRGQLDHMLIQPLPLWMQLATEGFMPFTGCQGAVLGLILTIVAAARLGLVFTPARLLLALYYMLLHAALRLSQNALYGAAAFWRPAACEEISTLIFDLNGQLGRFPLYGLPRRMLGILHTALPVGLLAWLPALALLRPMDPGTAILLPLAVAASFSAAALICFRKGLKHYETHSCNRYRNLGFRS